MAWVLGYIGVSSLHLVTSSLDAVLTAVKNIAMVGMTLLKINCELDLIKVSEDEILEKINDLIDFVMAAEISSYMLNVINKI